MLPKRLREQREQKKMTQGELGKIFGVDRATISRYETGDRDPDSELVRKFADFFGVTTDYLLGRTDDPHGTYLPPNMWPVGPMVRVPVLGVIRAGILHRGREAARPCPVGPETKRVFGGTRGAGHPVRAQTLIFYYVSAQRGKCVRATENARA